MTTIPTETRVVLGVLKERGEHEKGVLATILFPPSQFPVKLLVDTAKVPRVVDCKVGHTYTWTLKLTPKVAQPGRFITLKEYGIEVQGVADAPQQASEGEPPPDEGPEGNGKSREAGYEAHEHAMNRRTALMQAVQMVSAAWVAGKMPAGDKPSALVKQFYPEFLALLEPPEKE